MAWLLEETTETVIRSKADFKFIKRFGIFETFFSVSSFCVFFSEIFSQIFLSSVFSLVFFVGFFRGFFGMAEGEAIRLLEFEALHQALRSGGTSGGTSGGHVAILGDFNKASQSSATRPKFG